MKKLSLVQLRQTVAIPGSINEKRETLLGIREMNDGASSTPMFDLELDDERGIIVARLYDRTTKKLADVPARCIPLSNVACFEEANDAKTKTAGARDKREARATAPASEDGARSAD